MKINGKDKLYISVIAVVLIIALTVCGTVAYLTDHTGNVVNTFTLGNVTVGLTETDGVDGEGKWQHQIVPGVTYPKNPVVSVEDITNVDCWLFVKFEELNDASEYLIYTTLLTDEAGWTQGQETDGIPKNVWYRSVDADAATKSWNLLAGNEEYPDGCVTVRDTVTKDQVSKAADAKLDFISYAIQKDGFTAAANAWAAINE